MTRTDSRPGVRRRALVAFVVGALVACGGPRPGGSDATTTEVSGHHQLLIVLDGLRPDYVTPELMPTLYDLGRRGVVFTNHHAVFPTVTRVNASSISTGAYPSTHGLLGNAVFAPGVDGSRFLSTGDRENLLRIESAAGGRLLTAPTMGEQLHAAGLAMLVASAGSTGSSFLLNHTVAGGAVLHYDYALPAELYAEIRDTLGDVPPADTPNDARNAYIVDAFLQIGLPRISPAVSVIWLSDPDATAHAHGIGYPLTDEALSHVDRQVGRLLDGLRDANVLDETNIWVTSDHGFSTHTGGVDVTAILEPLRALTSNDVPLVVAGGGAIYVLSDQDRLVPAIVRGLQNDPAVGATFTQGVSPGSLDGHIAGTLSLGAARWDHDRSAAILFSGNWTSETNTFGYPGTSAQGGVAGHGSSSPFDIHNTLIAAGPDLKQGVEVPTPSGNIDFAPTFLARLGVEIPPTMQGRVLSEAFRDGPDPSTLSVEQIEHTVRTTGYQLTATYSVVGGYRYLDSTRVERGP